LQRGPPSAAPAPLAQQQDQKGTAQTTAGGSPMTAPPNAVGVPSVEQQVALLMPCLPPGASLKCVITGTEKVGVVARCELFELLCALDQHGDCLQYVSPLRRALIATVGNSLK
jgi:hypothetical protein